MATTLPGDPDHHSGAGRKVVAFRLERVVALRRNQWSPSGWNRWSPSAGKRMKEEQRHQLLGDLTARTEWINQRRTLDEIVPLPKGFGIAVRSFVAGAVRWRLVVLEENGKVSSLDLPFTCPAPTCELSSDVRGDRIAFLVAPADPDSQVPRRLVLTRLP